MRTFLFSLFLLSAFASVNAQNAAQSTPMKRIAWTNKAECMKIDFSEADRRELSVSCDSFISDGVSVKIVKVNELVVALIVGDDGDYMIGETTIINNTTNRILIDPSHASLFIWKDGDTKKNPERFGSIPGEKIASKIKRRIAWANALGAFGAGLQTQTTTVDSSSTGTFSANRNDGASVNGTFAANSQATITSPNVQAQVNEAIRARQRNNEAASAGSFYTSNGLKANTIFPNTTVGGYIYFPRKKAQFAIMTIEVGDILFDFAFKNPK